MIERDCANCKHHTEDGCSSWDCEFEAKLPKGELISKADAIELLTEIVFDEPPYFDSETLCRLYVEEQINKLPSADADVYEDYEHATLVDIKEPLKVLVVRCKDCRWWNSETKGCKRNPSVKAWQEDDFCKYGKRWSNAID